MYSMRALSIERKQRWLCWIARILLFSAILESTPERCLRTACTHSLLNVNNADYVDYVLGYSPKWRKIVISLLSMEGQRALGFYQQYIDLCYKDEWRSYGFGKTRGWVIINDRIFIFWWTIPLSASLCLISATMPKLQDDSTYRKEWESHLK